MFDVKIYSALDETSYANKIVKQLNTIETNFNLDLYEQILVSAQPYSYKKFQFWSTPGLELISHNFFENKFRVSSQNEYAQGKQIFNLRIKC
jgi:hypothetical protein